MPSLKRQIATNTFYLSASDGLQKIISFFVFLILVAKLSVHDYGVLTLLFTIPGPVQSFIGLGLGGLIATEIALARGQKDREKIKAIYLSYVKFSILTFLVILGGSFLFKDYLVAHYNIYLARFYSNIIIFVSGQFLFHLLSLLLGSHEEFLKSAIIKAGEPLFRLVVFLVLLLFSHINIYSAFAVYAWSKWFSFFFGLIISRKIIKSVLKARTGEFSLLRFVKKIGKWAIFDNIVGQIFKNITPWLIKFIVNVEAVAAFGVASKIFSLISKAIPIQSVLSPIISRNIKKQELVSLVIHKARKYYLLFALIVIGAIFLFSDIVFAAFFPKYIEASFLLKLYSLKLIISSFTIGQKSLLFAYRRQRFRFVLLLYGRLQRLALDIILLYHLHLVGVIISLLIHSSIMTVIKEIYIRRRLNLLKIDIKNYLKFDAYDKIILNILLGKFRFLNSKF